MKREILFKGLRSDNGEWIEGDLAQDHITGKFYISRQDGYPPTWNDPGGCDIFICKEVIPETISQFTGLTDKNGAKIFEGDILRKPTKDKWEELNFVSYEVFFHDNDHCESSIGYQMNRHHFHGSVCGTEEYFKFIPRNTKQFEIIGNIHDNG